MSYFNCFLLIYLIYKNKQPVLSPLTHYPPRCGAVQHKTKTRAWKKQHNPLSPRALLSYLLQCGHPHTLPPLASQASQMQADAHRAAGRFSPSTCRACRLLPARARLPPQPRLDDSASGRPPTIPARLSVYKRLSRSHA